MVARVIHLSSVHGAEDTRILHKECLTLQENGYDVTYIANTVSDFVFRDIKVVAFKRKRSGNRFIRVATTWTRMLNQALRAGGDLYHFHDPELIPVGLALKAMGKTVVADIHEHVHKQMLSVYWIPENLRPMVSRGYRFAERLVMRCFDGVIAATPGIAEDLVGVNTTVVRNYPLLAEMAVVEQKDYCSRRNNLLYIGNITELRGIVEMVRALEYPDIGADTKLLLAGRFSTPDLEAKVASEVGWQKVDFRGWLDRDGVTNLLSEGRVGLLLLKHAPNYMESFPVKLFEYMMAGLPVIASNIPFWKQFVEDREAGLMVDPDDPEAIAKAVRWMLDNPDRAREMGQRGKAAVTTYYNWNSEAVELLEVYRSVLEAS